MYGFRGYGSSAYGGIIEEKPIKVVSPDAFQTAKVSAMGISLTALLSKK
jgi:hypothetical protein